ncbi:small acid-soluble spore protein Tlp [Thalassobacillus pellis]|uniref:small acid-soluble spore protein Tlp n=1 Tax=Thalassobacillus pellis TaxID=748008 RepID=UPI001961396D|nr:small acid-soluble spore protein Tlp [Thalassobacillus pellis]MBM7552624.1 small acid-soluble spore protein (thioredoxin-like protein) [Thalassobacillus pellis]
MRQNHPNPDDRSDNMEKLQEMVQNTIQNIEKSHENYELASEKDKRDIENKNRKREESIQAMRNEIKDEARNQQ